tara:strand:+ start:3239 stop:3481 length:243 start_codon:yes stop_codon:yes gene_type:complete
MRVLIAVTAGLWDAQPTLIDLGILACRITSRQSQAGNARIKAGVLGIDGLIEAVLVSRSILEEQNRFGHPSFLLNLVIIA